MQGFDSIPENTPIRLSPEQQKEMFAGAPVVAQGVAWYLTVIGHGCLALCLEVSEGKQIFVGLNEDREDIFAYISEMHKKLSAHPHP